MVFKLRVILSNEISNQTKFLRKNLKKYEDNVSICAHSIP